MLMQPMIALVLFLSDAALQAAGAALQAAGNATEGECQSLLQFSSPCKNKSLNVGWNPKQQTSMTNSLNQQIASGSLGVYTGGKGVMIRNLNDGQQYDTNLEVVASTFWSNDIYAPTQIYPAGDPNGQDDFYIPVVVAVVGDSMDKIFMNFDEIQNDDWGYGVFYPTDSNAADLRCRYVKDPNNVYECNSVDPKSGTISRGTISADDGSWTDDPNAKGSGQWPAGNPYADPSWGGGTGCHFAYYNVPNCGAGNNCINQQNAKPAPLNLVKDNDCQCNYDVFKGNAYEHGDWKGWIGDWFSYNGQQEINFRDWASCWMNNIRDMINLQNWFWWTNIKQEDGYRWNTYTRPPNSKPNKNKPATQRYYWGWNEVPMSRVSWNTADYFQAILFVLPSAICSDRPNGKWNGANDGPWCLSPNEIKPFEDQIDWYRGNQPGESNPSTWLKLGRNNAASRPGSSVAFVRQVYYSDMSMNWYREFFCQRWKGNKYEVVFNKNKDACYIRCNSAVYPDEENC